MAEKCSKVTNFLVRRSIGIKKVEDHAKPTFGYGRLFHAHRCTARLPASRIPSLTRSAAFTLVEPLVVIGIIAILVAAAAADAEQARQSANVTVPLANLRQLGIGRIDLYAVQNKNVMPLIGERQYNYLVGSPLLAGSNLGGAGKDAAGRDCCETWQGFLFRFFGVLRMIDSNSPTTRDF